MIRTIATVALFAIMAFTGNSARPVPVINPPTISA